MITLKSREQIEMMAESCRRLSAVMEVLSRNLDAGITTREIDRIAASEIKKLGGIASFLNYNGFPASLCTSVNEEVVHGIPGSRKLKEGDIIGLDIGLIYKGWQSDMARTFGIGKISQEDQRLIDVTRQSFWAGFEQAKSGNRVGDISHAVQETAEAAGYGVVRELIGHGIGQKLHEDPEVPNFGRAGHGPRLQEGLVIAVEPMINAGTKDVLFMDDDWTVVTADGKKSAHYENTIAITQDGPRSLTSFEVDA